jgi:hypothetical protein
MTIQVESTVERKDPSLPRFVVVPDDAVAAWELEGTTIVEVDVQGTALGRRSLKRWPERGGWFFDLTEAQARRAGVDVGEGVVVELARASTELPARARRARPSREAPRDTGPPGGPSPYGEALTSRRNGASAEAQRPPVNADSRPSVPHTNPHGRSATPGGSP